MSTDWSAYSTPEQCREREGRPERFGVVQFPVGKVRQCPINTADDTLTVQHSPTKNNKAHTDIKGFPPEGDTFRNRIRSMLCDMAEAAGWAIPPETPCPENK